MCCTPYPIIDYKTVCDYYVYQGGDFIYSTFYQFITMLNIKQTV